MNSDPVIEIFSGTSWEAEVVKSLLSDARIPSFLKNDVLGNYLLDPIMAGGVKVMILESDREAAEEVVQWYYDRMQNGSDE
ncbi:MAG TPA: DUF2007 domain-containing protein [Bacteroidales bacterium]|nr:DUF2007 domain-containing protein [Bacteroidales bacterium]HNS45982.1 DUF2007 domain-containing protein [Bacteroidales bacterium]